MIEIAERSAQTLAKNTRSCWDSTDRWYYRLPVGVERMGEEQTGAMKVLTHWVMNLRIGNGPTPAAREEVRRTIAGLSQQECETLRALVADLLIELDGGNN